MKNVVFIVEGYSPDFSATGACANSIVEELSSKCKIVVIDRKRNSALNNGDDEYSSIRRYNFFENRIRTLIKEKLMTAQGIKRFLLLLFNIAVRGYGFIKFWFRTRDIKSLQVKAILKELKNINEKIDAIIPLCLPVEGIAAAFIYKKNIRYDVKVIPLLFDLFAENPTMHRTEKHKKRKYKRHIEFEREMCEYSEKLFFVEAWSNHLNKYFGKFKDKFCLIEHPLLKRVHSNVTINYDPEKINIVYTGALYKKIRSPLFSLKLISSLIEKDKRIALHFYINGDCNELVNGYCEKYPVNIINHGSVPRETAQAAMLASDFLLSIGNTDPNQIPSKIFEYISTGKPILHCCSIKEDPVIDILKAYTNSCCLESKEQVLSSDESKVLQFINNKMKQIEFEEVEKIYFTAAPKYTADKIMEILQQGD